MRVFVKSFGCSANLADGEVLAGCLAEAGFEPTSSVSSADVVIYNTCAVKGPTENRAVETLKRFPKKKRVIVAGCLPLINFERLCREVRFDGVVGPAAAAGIVNVVKRVKDGERVIELEGAVTAKPVLSLPRLRSNPVISVLPVSYGCLGECAYCCVLFARGRLRSYTVDEVIQRMKKDLAEGAKEFWITSQDAASYGRDIGTNITKLLHAIADIQDDFRVRVGMMTPNMTTDILSDLIEAFRNEKIYKFVHLPIQSGDNDVLKRMKRSYNAKEFTKIVNAFRTAFPEIALSTDVICGFPGETQQAFENTLRIISDIKPDIVNVSKFFARPKTAAAEMGIDFVEPNEVKRRSSTIANLAKRISLERNRRWIGWAGEVLLDEKGKIPGTWVGRNFAYKPIVIKNSNNLLGKTLLVKTLESFSTYLAGTIC